MAGMPLRRSTRAALEEDSNLLKVILARIAGAWEEADEDAETRKPKSPQDILRGMGLSYGAFITYVHEEEGRYQLWLRALEVRAQMLAEETLEIADGAEKDTAHLAKLQIDARQRIIKSWHKRLYGDDPMIQINQVVTDPTQIATKIIEIEKRLGLRADDPPAALPVPVDAETAGSL